MSRPSLFVRIRYRRLKRLRAEALRASIRAATRSAGRRGLLSLSDRVIDRLAEAEVNEPDLHLQADYQQALRTVVLAREGSPMPFVEASYALWGMHPEKVWPRILARRQAMLGNLVNFQAFKFAREVRNQEAPGASAIRASEGTNVRSKLLAMVAPVQSGTDPGRTGAAAEHNPAEHLEMRNGGKDSNPQQPAKAVSWVKRARVRLPAVGGGAR
jgi:hypothetical protein